MATTDTEVQNLIVNKLPYSSWKTAKDGETLSPTEAYEITDLDSVMVRRLSSSAATGGASQGVYVDANGQVQTCDAVTSTYSGTGTAPVNGTAVKSAIDAAIASVYKPAGSVAFANLPSPVKALLGNVYDVTDAFTTDSKFVNSGQSYPAGTNVVVINTTGTTYKYDVLPGFIDLTPYQLAETAVTHTKNTAAGSTTQPVYIASDGTATATTYALNKTVPADAVFTDTTYSDFVGAGASAAGSAGLVPAPAAGDNTKFLAGDGNWTTVDALPAQSGQSGKYLTTNGTAASWATVDALPSQTGNSGKYLTTNGTTASWGDAVEATESYLKTINSQSLLGSGDITITGLPSQTSQSGKFLTTNGTTASWANVDALPSQTGQSGKFLTTNGSAASWAAAPTPTLDGDTINTNSSSELQAIGVIEKNAGAVKYDWVGTLAQWTAGRSGGTIPDSWICYITDDETTSVSVDWSSLVNVPTYITALGTTGGALDAGTM